jgi:hypothetical protein
MTTRKLRDNEVEIVWLNGAREYFQTDGMVYGQNAIVLDVGASKVIIPMASVRLVRVATPLD